MSTSGALRPVLPTRNSKPETRNCVYYPRSENKRPVQFARSGNDLEKTSPSTACGTRSGRQAQEPITYLRLVTEFHGERAGGGKEAANFTNSPHIRAAAVFFFKQKTAYEVIW